MNSGNRKRIIIFVSIYLCIQVFSPGAYAQERTRKNFSWTFENKNDPILQVKNESDDALIVEVRLLFEDESYRYPEDLEVPPGESRFLRIREAVERLSRRYNDLRQVSSGNVQIQFAG